MKQRLGLACALVHDRTLSYWMNLPMASIRRAFAEMRNMIIHLSKDLGKTLLVSSHLLSEMEVVANSMLIINKGRKVVEGNVQQLLNPEKSVIEFITDERDATVNFITQSEWAEYYKRKEGKYHPAGNGTEEDTGTEQAAGAERNPGYSDTACSFTGRIFLSQTKD